MDKLERDVAAAVYTAVEEAVLSGRIAGILGRPQADIEVHHLGDKANSTLIRVRTSQAKKSARYFRVTAKEAK